MPFQDHIQAAPEASPGDRLRASPAWAVLVLVVGLLFTAELARREWRAAQHRGGCAPCHRRSMEWPPVHCRAVRLNMSVWPIRSWRTQGGPPHNVYRSANATGLVRG